MARDLLVVVDMQHGFLREGNLANARCLEALEPVRREVDRALSAGWPLVLTADTHEVDDAEFATFPEHCVRGTSEAELVDELRPAAAQPEAWVVRKRRYSALHDSELPAILKRYAIDRVRVCGVAADICVTYTTADLRNLDLPVTVAAAATRTFDLPDHPGEEIERRTFDHMRTVLGAEVDDDAA